MSDNISRMNNKGLSQLDLGSAIRNAHDYEGNSLRVRDTVSVVKDYFTHYRATFNGDDKPTEVTYLRGIQPHITQVGTTSDVSGSLNNKYFFIYEAISDQQYYIWFNVAGAGTDPAIANSIGIEVPISTNEDASIVAFGIELAINNNSTACRFFDARRINGVVKITTKRFGETASSVDGNTGFLITNTPGEEKEVEKIFISYDGSGNPEWEGESLPGYNFNIFTGKFELPADIGNITVDFTPTTAQTPGVINLSLGLAGVESSASLPLNTVRFMVKPRSTAKLQFSYTSGQSGTNYITINKGASYYEEGLQLTGATDIYIQAPENDNETVEILYWI